MIEVGQWWAVFSVFCLQCPVDKPLSGVESGQALMLNLWRETSVGSTAVNCAFASPLPPPPHFFLFVGLFVRSNLQSVTAAAAIGGLVKTCNHAARVPLTDKKNLCTPQKLLICDIFL